MRIGESIKAQSSGIFRQLRSSVLNVGKASQRTGIMICGRGFVPGSVSGVSGVIHTGRIVERAQTLEILRITPLTRDEQTKEGDYVELRPYQKSCIEAIEAQPPGAYLCQLATGLGKTVIAANIPRQGRMLWLSHREELCRQPEKYFDCSFGIERAELRSNGEEVISASVQTLVRRLDKFKPDEFDIVVVDEAQHSPSKTYRKILQYFKPRKTIGNTATPSRGDKVRLDDIYEKIIFQRDLKWGIESGYLSDIYCLRCDIGYDLTGIRSSRGDYAPGELEERMEGTADAIAEAYQKYAVGQTLIFAVSVHQCEEIAKRIPGAVVVTGETKDREQILKDFTARKIPCIVNCMVFTEGTDLPLVETVLIARPTQSESLYCQMVGRGTRLSPGKDRLILIDCVGTSALNLCTAPTLLGIDMEDIPAEKRDEVQGELFELPEKAVAASDGPLSWIKSAKVVDLWKRKNGYDTRKISFTLLPTGELTVSLLDGKRITIPAPDALGQVLCNDGSRIPMQQAIDKVYAYLLRNHADERYLWDLDKVKSWGRNPATDKQIALVRRVLKEQTPEDLTKWQAKQFIDRLTANRKRGTRRAAARA